MDEFECSICCDTLDDPRLLPCGHMFCGPGRGCILAMNKNNVSVDCPNCRKTHYINVKELGPIYVLNNFLVGQKKIADVEDKQKRSLSSGSKSCDKHSDNFLSYFCDTCDISICEVCWGNEHSEHKVGLLKVKQKKDVMGAIERANLESTISVYEKVIGDNRNRRQMMLEVLTEIDVVNQLLGARTKSLLELNELCKEYVGLDSNSAKLADLGEQLLEDLKIHQRNNKDDEIKKNINQISKESQKKFKTFVNLCGQNEKTLNEMKQSNKQAGLKIQKPDSGGKGDARSEVSAVEKDLKAACSGSQAACGSAVRVDSVSNALLNMEEQVESDGNDSDAGSEASSAVGGASSQAAGPVRPKSGKNRRPKRIEGSATSRGGGSNQRGGGGSSQRGGGGSNQRGRGGPSSLVGVRFPGPGAPANLMMQRPQMFRHERPPFIAPPMPSPMNPLMANINRPLLPMQAPSQNGPTGDHILDIDKFIVYIRGDLFATSHSLAYTVSEEFVFAYGVAIDISRRFSPIPNLCRQSKKTGGDLHCFADSRVQPQRYIYTLITKPQGGKKCDFHSLERSLMLMRDHAKRNNVKTICIPRTLACTSMEGLNWASVEVILKNVFSYGDINIFVYSST